MASASMASSYNALLTRCERSAAWLRATHLLHEARVAERRRGAGGVQRHVGRLPGERSMEPGTGTVGQDAERLGNGKKKLQEFG
jgi:hypothetical protein